MSVCSRAGFALRGSAAGVVLAALSLVGWAAAACAQPTRSATDQILLDARTPATVRSMLLGHAKRVLARDPIEAGQALMWAGQSCERGGLADSALLCYRSAVPLRQSNDEALAVVDILLLRGRARDLLEAYEIVAGLLQHAPPGAFGREEVLVRSMWVQHLAGHPDSAAAAFRQIDGRVALDDLWTMRAAQVLLEDLKDQARAGESLLPLEVRSRGQDATVHDLFTRAAAAFGWSPDQVMKVVSGAVQARDESERVALTRAAARRVVFSASDGFLLSGVVHPARRDGARAAVVISRGDTLAHYDSLLVHLERAGFATIIMDPRGYGASVGPSCPLPFRWRGREESLEERVGADVADALRMLARTSKVDTNRVLLVASGEMVHSAMSAAATDPRVKAVVLASPEPARVDRGVLLGLVAAARKPLFVQTAPEDLVDLYYYADALYQAGDRKLSRVSSGTEVGRFVEQFQTDQKSGARLEHWLGEIMPAGKR